jgi:hypothetical protein
MRRGQTTGPCVENLKRVGALFDALKQAGRRGTFMSALMASANASLEERIRIRNLPYLHFLVFGRTKSRTGTHVGGYLSGIIEPVPGAPANARFLRLKPRANKRALMRELKPGLRATVS